MTPPRHCEKGQTLYVTVQAVSRQFRFVPTKDVRDSINYLFALMVAKYGLLVHEYTFLSNHFHFSATDPEGHISAFLQELDSRLSRQLNALRGTSGSNFAREPGIQVIVDAAGVVQKSVYTLVNPLVAHLVARLRDWKASTSANLEYGEPVTFPRPPCGLWAHTRAPRRQGVHASRGRLRFRGRSNAPVSATFTLAAPPDRMGMSPAELRREIRKRVAEQEADLIQERRRRGISVLGWTRVITQRPNDAATSRRELFQRRPRVTGQEAAACGRAIGTLDRFVAAYRVALEAFKAGGRPTFPYGTLQIVQRYNLPCATAPP